MSTKPLSTRVSRQLKKGAEGGKDQTRQGNEIMAFADRNGLPVSVCTESATPHEVTVAMSTLPRMVVPEAPPELNRRQRL